jgi:flavorubredoxin
MENKVAENVYWVGVYFKEKGSGVNAFLIKDDKTALIDTGPPITQELVINNIKNIIDLENLDYIVLTHAEVDHCGALGKILQDAKNSKVCTSEIGAMLVPIYGFQAEMNIVKPGDVLNLGEKTLRFISTPLVDTWDTLFVFEEMNRILFTADAFGTFGQPNKDWKLFAQEDITDALKVYNAIKFPWIKVASKDKIKKAIEDIKALKPNIIAPGHGPLIRENIDKCCDILAEV